MNGLLKPSPSLIVQKQATYASPMDGKGVEPMSPAGVPFVLPPPNWNVDGVDAPPKLKLVGAAGLEPNAGILGVESFTPLALEAPNWKAPGAGALVKLKLGTVVEEPEPKLNVGALGAVSFVPFALEAPNWKVGGAGLLLKLKVDETEDEAAGRPKLGSEGLFSATPLELAVPTAGVEFVMGLGLVVPNNEPPLLDVVCAVPLLLAAPNLKVAGAVVVVALVLEKPKLGVAVLVVVVVEELAGSPNTGRLGLFSDNPLEAAEEVDPNNEALGAVPFVPLVFETPNVNETGAEVLLVLELVEVVIELETEGVALGILDVNPNLNFESGGGNVDGFSVGASLELAVVPSLLVKQQGHEFLSASTWSIQVGHSHFFAGAGVGAGTGAAATTGTTGTTGTSTDLFGLVSDEDVSVLVAAFKDEVAPESSLALSSATSSSAASPSEEAPESVDGEEGSSKVCSISSSSSSTTSGPRTIGFEKVNALFLVRKPGSTSTCTGLIACNSS